jgi:arylsulfatase A-like enzyme
MHATCRSIVSVFILLITLSFSSAAQSTTDRPNIIYIMADDLGYADLSCYGRKDYQTPNLDRLAAQGIKFTNAYAAGALCTPTRVAFMTGRYPARTSVGLMEPLVPRKSDSAYGLSVADAPFPLLLKDAGYETALIGKWHLGFLPEYAPNKNGFDYFFGIKTGAADYVSHKGDLGYDDLYENEKPVREDGYMTELISKKVVTFLKQRHDKPFFLSLQFTAPHWPWQGPGDAAYPDTMNMRAGGSPQIYAAMMKSLDDAIGEIMETLEETKLAGRTVVIFTSDNGGERYSDMGPYSKRKMTLWEGGIRVPAFIRWPGKIAGGTSTDQAAITMDWTATILSLAGAKPDKRFTPDGKDLTQLLFGKQASFDRVLYWRLAQRVKQNAIREGKWKYLKVENEEYLFDLSNDLSEKNNLKAKEPQIFERLKQQFSKWEAGVLKPIPL